jgi:lipopolysaccharide biosynthesis protein
MSGHPPVSRDVQAWHPPRVIAMYLPQFHPIPENDRWWGRGFTEWTNVAQGRPLFHGHYQPHWPGELGFYDLRLPEVRETQASLAQAHGIEGFCYYHYWFNGVCLLERPFNEVLASGSPNFPFCLCWANENWTRVWDGGDKHTLMRQFYGDEDDRQHVRSLLPAFADPRYIRIGNRPIFIIYRPGLLPNAHRTTDIWREQALKSGIGELFLVKVDRFQPDLGDPAAGGFDAAAEFQPSASVIAALRPRHQTRAAKLGSRVGLFSRAFQDHMVFDYGQFAGLALNEVQPGYRRFPCVTPMWDNTARKKRNGFVLSGSSPELYERWLTAALGRSSGSPDDICFVNGWNEWAEGNHLEPDRRWGRAYLEATRRARSNVSEHLAPLGGHTAMPETAERA